jgi:hypothetical protein
MKHNDKILRFLLFEVEIGSKCLHKSNMGGGTHTGQVLRLRAQGKGFPAVRFAAAKPHLLPLW